MAELLNIPLDWIDEILKEEEYRRDCRKYFSECLKIRDKNGNIIAFVPNEHQGRVIDIVENWKREYPDERIRPTLFIIILKARQIGFSTCIEGIFFHELHFNRNKIAMVVSYDEDSAQNINDMSDRFYQYLPKDIKPMRRPARGKGILFENPTNKPEEFEKNPGLQSKFLIDTAANKNAGSSFTINYLHLSELSKWVNAKDTLTSLLQAVPQYGGIVVIESTAKGLELFHSLWQQAKTGELKYVPVFVPWHAHSEYARPFINDDERQQFILDEEEKRLKETYGLSYEQLNWRRYTIKTKCHGDKNEFYQEYPSNDTECFLTSGRPVFDRLKVNTRISYLQEKYKDNSPDKGYIEYNENTGKYEFVPDLNGTFIIYEHPKPNYPYVFGGDVAEGLRGGDWSVTSVCDNTTGNQVAVLRGHWEPDIFALEQIKLARYYNDAFIADEVNNHGLTTIKTLQQHNYFNQYKREVIDEISKVKQHKFGFRTDTSTRPRIIDRVRAIVRDNIELINDITTLQEMLTFVYTDSGKEEAESDCFDDCVMAFAIMHEARTQYRSTPPKEADRTFEGFEVHPSVKIDSTKNQQLKEYYRKQYEAERIQISGG